MADIYQANPEKLWWYLLSSAIDEPETSTRLLTARFVQAMEQPVNHDSISQILAKIEGTKKRIFLVDGLEIAFNARHIFTYTEALFRFMQIVETDSRLSKYIHIKIFIRSSSRPNPCSTPYSTP